MNITNTLQKIFIGTYLIVNIPFHLAAEHSDLTEAEAREYNEIYNKISNPDIPVKDDLAKCKLSLFELRPSLLHHAVDRRNLSAIQAIIGRNKDFANKTDTYTYEKEKKELSVLAKAFCQLTIRSNWTRVPALKEYDIIISFLVQNGADVTIPLFDNIPTLHAAAVFGLEKSIQAIIATGKPDINATTDKNVTPLEAALRSNQPASVRILVTHKALIRQETLKDALLVRGLDNEIRTLIVKTALNNNLSNIDLTKILDDGQALGKHVYDYIESLSKYDPDKKELAAAFTACTEPTKNILNSFQKTPAPTKAHDEIFKKVSNPRIHVRNDILQYEVDFLKSLRAPFGDKYSLLHHAVNRRNLGAVRAILEKDKSLVNLESPCSYIDYSSKNVIKREVSALTYAFLCAWECHGARNEYDFIIELLVKKGAAVTTPWGLNRTALHLAAMLGFEKSIQAIIATGKVKVNDEVPVNDDIKTPLEEALWNGHLESVKILIKNGAIIGQKALEITFSSQSLDNELCTFILEKALRQDDLEIDLQATVDNGESLINKINTYIDGLSTNDPDRQRLAKAFKACKNHLKDASTSLQEIAPLNEQTVNALSKTSEVERLVIDEQSKQIDNKSDEDKSRSPLLIGAGTMVLLGCMVGIGNFLYKRFKTKKEPQATDPEGNGELRYTQ